jgi:hypothetical protein
MSFWWIFLIIFLFCSNTATKCDSKFLKGYILWIKGYSAFCRNWAEKSVQVQVFCGFFQLFFCFALIQLRNTTENFRNAAYSRSKVTVLFVGNGHFFSFLFSAIFRLLDAFSDLFFTYLRAFTMCLFPAQSAHFHKKPRFSTNSTISVYFIFISIDLTSFHLPLTIYTCF